MVRWRRSRPSAATTGRAARWCSGAGSGSGPAIEELIVNGVFAMDSSETATERTLGELAVDAATSTTARPRVLVGGLGLGYTVSEILASPIRTAIEVEIDVVEIEECLIDWARAGVTRHAGPRWRPTRGSGLHAADIARSSAVAGAEPQRRG